MNIPFIDKNNQKHILKVISLDILLRVIVIHLLMEFMDSEEMKKHLFVRRPTGTIHTSYFILHTSLILSLYFIDKFRFRISDFRLQTYLCQNDMCEIGSRKVGVEVDYFLKWSFFVKRFVKAIFTLIWPYYQCEN